MTGVQITNNAPTRVKIHHERHVRILPEGAVNTNGKDPVLQLDMSVFVTHRRVIGAHHERQSIRNQLACLFS